MSNQARSRALAVMKGLAHSTCFEKGIGLCRFHKALAIVCVCVFTGGVGGSAGSGPRGAGPAQHHSGAGAQRQRVSHANRPERGRAHH